MNTFEINRVFSSDQVAVAQVKELLRTEGIQMDKNLEYTCSAITDQNKIAATGSCYGNTLRCLAVRDDYKGYGLLNQVVSHLVDYQFSKGRNHLFVYTKSSTSKFFRDLGFFEIVHVKDKIAFFENRPRGFSDFLLKLSKEKREGQKIAAIVMNANPFTKGHLHLLETASRENDWVHLFIVSEDTSLFPFSVRKRLVLEGSQSLKNIVYHETGPYMISQDTFPSYFQRDEVEVIETQSLIDLSVFKSIAKVLHITSRYVGEEPNSIVTNIYNKTMKDELPKDGIDCVIIPRLEASNQVISASTVRSAIQLSNIHNLHEFLPQSTIDFILSEEALPILNKIKNTPNVIHY